MKTKTLNIMNYFISYYPLDKCLFVETLPNSQNILNWLGGFK
jgi:hypothetical protein